MISPFIINDKNLFLDRFPTGQVNRSLQAWDAADEYIISYLEQQPLSDSKQKILIFNDNFGAIACNLTEHQLYCVNDSFLSHQGIELNIEQNGLSNENITLLTSLDELPSDINIVLYKIPKGKGLLCQQLSKIKQQLSKDVVFIASDRAKEIHSSTLKLFENYLGTTKTSLAVKKARLVFCELDNEQATTANFTTSWPLENTDFTLHNHANVYAREKLDIGARYFMENLPTIAANKQVIDLGCGNGVIGLHVLSKQPEAQVHFIDESYMAIASAKLNITENLPSTIEQCHFQVNDCLTSVEGGSVDFVLCNPPFHQQTATTDHIAWQMFKDSHRVLKKGGELRIIGNRQLGYHIKLKRIFGNQTLIASNDKFVTISAIKR
ncbi:methyltransferase [Cognaticolwellia beringensis]|uniref:Ribosomal RNA large subunit methyltransferase G n=1 Tax=Cognaticolwellia beringensis TaxID=1967665 RepID=A0A222G4F4_9GAMM|nr:methyltransferase [Cognaticolwellia beringensis]ASP46788.1 23S rRNA (guanine(1835)-N(2))-methyltransferase [Cognaticolwellia beringensis]